jgi:hypothetical protein
MKKLLFVFTLFLAGTAYGQFTKGTRTVGFNLSSSGFNSNSSTYEYAQSASLGSKTNNMNLSITPSLGKFINEKTLVGVNLNINFSNNKYTSGINEDKGNSFSLGLGGFGRYYFTNTGFMPYAQGVLGVAYGNGKFTWVRDYSNVTTPYLEKGSADQKGIFTINAGAGLGLTKMVNKSIGFDLGVGYLFSNSNYKYTTEANRQYSNPVSSEQVKGEYKYSNYSNGVTLSIGFLIFLDPKNK